MDIRTSALYSVASCLAAILYNVAYTQRAKILAIGDSATNVARFGAFQSLAADQIRIEKINAQGDMLYLELKRTMGLLIALGHITQADANKVEKLYWNFPTMRRVEGEDQISYPVRPGLKMALDSEVESIQDAVMLIFFEQADVVETNNLIKWEFQRQAEHNENVRLRMSMGGAKLAQRLVKNHIGGYTKQSDRREMAELLVEADQYWQPRVDAEIAALQYDPEMQEVKAIRETVQISYQEAEQVIAAVSKRIKITGHVMPKVNR